MKIVASALHFEWEDIEHCLERVRGELGLDGVELSWSNGFRHPHSTLEDLDVLRGMKGQTGCELSAHIWENLAQLPQRQAEGTLIGWLELAEQTGVTDLIVHGGTHADQEEGVARTRRVFESVLPRFESAGVVINLENHYAYDYRDCQELFSEPWEFTEVFSLESSSLRFCFDTGHGHMTRNWADLVSGLAPWLNYVHLADNYGESDDHCMFRKGTVPWDAMFDLLKETGFDGVFCVEFPAREDLGPFRECVAELSERFGS